MCIPHNKRSSRSPSKKCFSVLQMGSSKRCFFVIESANWMRLKFEPVSAPLWTHPNKCVPKLNKKKKHNVFLDQEMWPISLDLCVFLGSLGPCGFLEDRQQLVLHITSAPETSKDWDWVKAGSRVAWVGKLLEDKGSWTLRFWPDVSCLHMFVHSLSDL